MLKHNEQKSFKWSGVIKKQGKVNLTDTAVGEMGASTVYHTNINADRSENGTYHV
jgi:hypothetical protein